MNLVAEYRVPAGSFALGRILATGTVGELERLVGEEEAAVLYVWVENDASSAFEPSPSDSSGIDDLELLDETATRGLYRCQCPRDSDSLVGALLAHDVRVLSGVGDDSQWQFRLSFPDRNALSEFQCEVVDDNEVGLELEKVYNPLEAAAAIQAELTDTQRETLLRAYEEGYFDIPRGITLVDLADILGVSDQAVSERMRRGEAKLVRTHLVDATDG